ncbi:hypothetical protein [Desertibacillus haloalkaliphilus]|uniref:hypothetical protein n=1 Tax=Desertibacillus haloalkaliphilus TaxID=1328930 RepID=UPI001C275417|nr:hypothetical protein [Desertibacillus haloalkaliphilus]MBU8908176.1 hypothetical protein [Desertibacillus haloalkaliphilus]
MTRVTNVRKDTEVLKKHYETKGISLSLAELDVKVNVSLDDDTKKLYQKFVNAIKRKIQIPSMQSLQTFIHQVSFGQYRIDCQVYEDQGSTADYYLRLLASCSDSTKESEVRDHVPLEVTVRNHEGSDTGYSLLHGTFSKRKIKGTKVHGVKWKMKSGISYTALYDMKTLLAETLIHNALDQFAVENKDLLQYQVVKHFLLKDQRHPVRRQKNEITIPSNHTMAGEWKRIVKSQCRDISEDCFIENDALNEYLPIFQLAEVGDVDIKQYKMFILPEFLHQMDYLRLKTKHEVEQSKDYAKSYQTKKHITKEKRERMDNNEFLRRFGFVELDNDVCMDKFATVEKDFLELLNHVYMPDCREGNNKHSFRIRKLGKQRAAGLYYPAPIRSLNFDLSHPSAFVHELGHLLDNELSSKPNSLLSEQMDFRPVLDQYVQQVTDKVKRLDKNDPFRQQWEGKSKFNGSYYCMPTEVFARCYEVYVWNKGIRSSLLKKDYSDKIIYMLEDTFVEQVKSYFDSLFSFFEPSQTETTEEGEQTESDDHDDKELFPEIQKALEGKTLKGVCDQLGVLVERAKWTIYKRGYDSVEKYYRWKEVLDQVTPLYREYKDRESKSIQRAHQKVLDYFKQSEFKATHHLEGKDVEVVEHFYEHSQKAGYIFRDEEDNVIIDALGNSLYDGVPLDDDRYGHPFRKGMRLVYKEDMDKKIEWKVVKATEKVIIIQNKSGLQQYVKPNEAKKSYEIISPRGEKKVASAPTDSHKPNELLTNDRVPKQLSLFDFC